MNLLSAAGAGLAGEGQRELLVEGESVGVGMRSVGMWKQRSHLISPHLRVA